MTKVLAPNLVGKITNLEVSFGDQVVIQSASVSIYKNKIHVLSGPSGSGKTTFLRSLNRLNDCFESSRTKGEILLELDGEVYEIQSLKPSVLSELRRKVAMVFQNPNLLPGSMESNILLPLKVVSKLKGEAAREKLQSALNQAQLWEEVKDRLHQPASSLSGGQQQRLCLARALALEPEILLLDEPTSSLDPEVSQQIEVLIQNLSKNYSIVMVSHSREQTERLADHVIRFDQGKIIE